jgi:hypothetical protein
MESTLNIVESPERLSLSDGVWGYPLESLPPPSPAGEGGRGDEVSVFSYFVVLVASQHGGLLRKQFFQPPVSPTLGGIGILGDTPRPPIARLPVGHKDD